MYVIKRNEDGAFVARSPIRSSSYVRALQDAQVYATAKEAEGHACGNETVISVEKILGRE